jgi:hypothetical protein
MLFRDVEGSVAAEWAEKADPGTVRLLPKP